MYSKELVKGTLRTIVLHLLAEQGRMYGYEMTQKVLERSDEKFQLTEGSLYPTLHKMVSEGLLVTETEKVGGRTRKYYRLTPAGQAATSNRLAELRDFMRTLQQLLDLNPTTD